METIPLSRPDIGPDEIAAVMEVLSGPHLSLGPRLAAFEDSLARYLGAKHVAAVSSGTAGLHLAIRALGLKAGDEVITTPFSFIASANALLFENIRPVFADIDPNTWNLDPNRVESAITPKTRGILAVHVFGYPAPMTELADIAKRHNLVLIEDACEALGSTYQGQKAGTLGDMAVFGFYPNKQMTTGEGGAVVSKDPKWDHTVRILRNQGRDPKGDWLDAVELGYNYRISDLNCALGIAQLKRLDTMIAQRRKVAETYDHLLADNPNWTLPPRPKDPSDMSWFVYVIRLASKFTRKDRDHIVNEMSKRGIMCGRYFAPIHLQPLYRNRFGYKPAAFPITEVLCDRTLALPFFKNLTKGRIGYIKSTLCHVVK